MAWQADYAADQAVEVRLRGEGGVYGPWQPARVASNHVGWPGYPVIVMLEDGPAAISNSRYIRPA